MRETRVQSLSQEDPLEKKMATHSSTLAWKIPWKEEPRRLQSMGSLRVRHDWATWLHFHSTHILLLCSSVASSWFPPGRGSREDKHRITCRFLPTATFFALQGGSMLWLCLPQDYMLCLVWLIHSFYIHPFIKQIFTGPALDVGIQKPATATVLPHDTCMMLIKNQTDD